MASFTHKTEPGSANLDMSSFMSAMNQGFKQAFADDRRDKREKEMIKIKIQRTQEKLKKGNLK